MNKKQRKELFVVWDLYGSARKKQFITDYFVNGGEYSQESWLNYLRANLDLEDFWDRAAQA